MTFLYPWVLTALALPVLALVATWRHRNGVVALPFDHSPRRGSRVLHAVLRIGESLPALILAVAILLLAGPQKVSAPRSKRSLTNIQFCVDVSGSMTAQFGEGDRYDASMAAIANFVDARSGDAFGLTFFGNQYMHWVPLTNDPTAFKCATPFMNPRSAPPGFGGTEIGKAVMACREVLLERGEGDRLLILVSDGYSADLGGDRPQEIARKLKDDGIVLYAIHIAEPPVPDQIIDISRWTGGDAFNPEDRDALDRVFRHIDQMQAARVEKVLGEQIDDFDLLAVVGLSLLGAYALFQCGLRHTPW